MNKITIETSPRLDWCGSCKKEHGFDCPKDKKNKLLILKGLPASGKSTYAKELVAKGWKRVNKDDLRAMIDDSKWSKKNEEQIKEIEKVIVQGFLGSGFNVVVDDTNFGYEQYWNDIAVITGGAEFEVKFFDVPLMECIERDAKRGDKSVGAKVIQRMYDQFLKPKALEYSDYKQNCYIFDIDGTLAKMCDRSPYDYSKVSGDTVNKPIKSILDSLDNNEIIICSGRLENCRLETEEWLKVNDINYSKLLMRTTDDKRKDSVVKKELYEQHIKGMYNVLGVFDDRNQVVDMWRSLGITCLQVDYGNF